MKKIILTACLALCALNLSARAIRDEANLTDNTARASYAFGMMIGSELLSSGMEVDYARFAEGLRATMEKQETKLSEEEASEVIQSAFEAARTRQAEENRIKEELFLAANKERPEVKTTPSGLQYEVLAEGQGARPAADSTVKVNYEGTLIDGTVFDSSYERGEPAEFPLDRVIPGWTEGIQLMSAGSKYRFYIPSALAYGGRGAGSAVPPFATLLFTVELLEIIAPESEETAE